MPFCETGNVRIRYEGAGSGVPPLVTPGGGLSSRVSNWPAAVVNAMERLKGDFRCIAIDHHLSLGSIPGHIAWRVANRSS